MGEDDLRDVAVECEIHEAEVWAECVGACRSVKSDPLAASVVRRGAVSLPALRAVNFWLFNRVIGLGIAEPATEELVSDIVAHYSNSGQSSYCVALSPVGEPPELAGWLEGAGMSAAARFAKMWRSSSDPPAVPETSLRVEVAHRAFAPEFERVSVDAWGASPLLAPWFSAVMGRQGWYHYMAFDGDTPVATAAMRVEGPFAWLGFAATLPSHRRRGAQSALLVERVRDAEALGCQILHAETAEETAEVPNPSYRNLVRVGFRLLYQRPNFVANPA